MLTLGVIVPDHMSGPDTSFCHDLAYKFHAVSTGGIIIRVRVDTDLDVNAVGVGDSGYQRRTVLSTYSISTVAVI